MQRRVTNSTILVLGGVRGGKSRYAQTLAQRMDRVALIATAECRDDEEMRLKIERHRAERPSSWTIIEELLHLEAAIQSADGNCDAVVVDCLTLFAVNLLEALGNDEVKLHSLIDGLYAALRAATGTVIVISNEVGSGVVPAYASGRRFRDLVGEINQHVAAIADTVLLMVAGLPLVLKGREVWP